jgi:hypothetical protein
MKPSYLRTDSQNPYHLRIQENVLGECRFNHYKYVESSLLEISLLYLRI